MRKIIINVLAVCSILIIFMGCHDSGSGKKKRRAAQLEVEILAIKKLAFSWSDVPAAASYRIFENPDGVSGFSQVAEVDEGVQMFELEIPLHKRPNAAYLLQTCYVNVCVDSDVATLNDSLEDAVGYFKASNSGSPDRYGSAVRLSGDGSTLAVGAYAERSSAQGIDGDQLDDTATDAGAVYVFSRVNNIWVQQAYIKASNTDPGDRFGWSLSLSSDGNTLAVGAARENSSADGVNGDELDNSAENAGAAYIFERSSGSWSQHSYIKASNSASHDFFGYAVSISGDGLTLAVGASEEDGISQGINGDQTNTGLSTVFNGAVYVYKKELDVWSQEAYIKSSNLGNGDSFGGAVDLSFDGNRLLVGAGAEDSSATGVNGDGDNNDTGNSGAAYIFDRTGSVWVESAYLKAHNTGRSDVFGLSVAIDNTGETLIVGSDKESGGSAGVNGPDNDDLVFSGAAYVFEHIGAQWVQTGYLKASNPDVGDDFGGWVAISGDGDTVAAGAIDEGSIARGINGDQVFNQIFSSGAVYVFKNTAAGWLQESYVKARNTGRNDRFGISLDFDDTGDTLVVGARDEDDNLTGIGSPSNNLSSDSGAVYLY